MGAPHLHRPPCDINDLTRDIRSALHDAQRVGNLPSKPVRFRVSGRTFPAGRSVHVDVDGLPPDQVYDPSMVDAHQRFTDAAVGVRDRVRSLVEATTDGSDVPTYTHVQMHA